SRGYDSTIIDFLRETKTRATFFAGGKWIVPHWKRAREIIADPLFEVGNHTWEHRNLRWVRGERLLNEINAPQIAYRQVHAELVRQQCVALDLLNPVISQTCYDARPGIRTGMTARQEGLSRARTSPMHETSLAPQMIRPWTPATHRSAQIWH